MKLRDLVVPSLELAFALALIAALITAPAAQAGGPKVQVLEDRAQPVTGQTGDGVQSVQSTCSLAPGPLSNISIAWTDPGAFTSFAWRIPVSSCTVCAATGVLDVKSVSVRLRWWSACSAQAEVSIVGATGDPACPVPDPTNVLCGPATYTVSGTGASGTIHTLPLPNGCCIMGETFALVRFIGLEACASAPGGTSVGLTTASAACAGCQQYVTVAGFYPSLTDWCTVSSVGTPLWMQVDADCCPATNVAPRSWGRLKTLYR